MGLESWAYTVADADFYEPLTRHDDTSVPFAPAQVPAGWQGTRRDLWMSWERPGLTVPEQGWKVHVSARLERAQAVLDTVAGVCFAMQIPFKHLASEYTYLFTHHKHAARAQAGKFCAIYPPDVDTAREVLRRLHELLRDEDGPYILSDRRYRDSRTVHYRYGAFRALAQVRPDGGVRQLVRDRTGALVDDHRTTRFVLPPGITDPFVAPASDTTGEAETTGEADTTAEAKAAGDGGVHLRHYLVLRALSHSNAGGAYRARDTRSGREVFIKEARAHNGIYWDRSTARQRLRREHRVLRDLHERAPGLAPEPLDYFQEWEHEFLVTELLPGSPLADFVAQRSPLTRTGATRDEVGAYFETCRQFLRQLAAALQQLHRLGYRFGDVNPMNMLVTPDGDLRLIDFEACGRLDEPEIQMGAPGFLPERLEDRAGTGADFYGLSAIALSTILPLHLVAERNPAILAHLHADASRLGAVPPDLWSLARRNFDACRPADDPDGGCLPGPDEVAADPIGQLRRLRDAVGQELATMADPGDAERTYPTVPRGFLTNTLCVAYGTAGVLHALYHAGQAVDPAVVDQLRARTRRQRDDLPPGLHTGLAGIGWVLAELGHLQEAVELANAAATHPTTLVSCSWGEGSAGVGATQLALYARTGDGAHLARAAAIGQALCTTEDLTPLVGPRNAVGLLHGRAGVALFLHDLWRATGDERYLRHGTRLLHAELDRAIEMPDRELGFPDNEVSRRAMTYLGTGSAGVGHVLTRYVRAGGDDRFAALTPRVFAYVDKPVSVEAGLYQGLAGMAYALAEHGGPAGSGSDDFHARAVRTATALFKYAVPTATGGVRFLGEQSLRFSAELWSGSAGVLLALDRILNGPGGHFFTLDGLLPGTGQQLAGAARGRSGDPSDLAGRR